MVGIAINDSIVVLAELRSDEGCRRGKIESIVELVSLSTRHVLCTTFTVGCSFIPMLLEGGRFGPDGHRSDRRRLWSYRPGALLDSRNPFGNSLSNQIRIEQKYLSALSGCHLLGQ